MFALTVQMMVHFTLITGAVPSYQQALQTAQKEGKPLVVFVGADWCPGCQKMKNEQLPVILKRGIFKHVVFTMVNTDQQPALTERLLTVNSIPQLIIFVKGANGWHRAHLIGVQDPEAVRKFIARETAAAGANTRVANQSTTETATATQRTAQK